MKKYKVLIEIRCTNECGLFDSLSDLQGHIFNFKEAIMNGPFDIKLEGRTYEIKTYLPSFENEK